jgi:DNA-binding transcriptional LysR family regulator
MSKPRNVLTPDALSMLQSIASVGSFAAAARTMNMVPSALTYRVRQIEDSLDVLLFDRSTRQARLTTAGKELIVEGSRLLKEIESLANRVKRVATGWETQFTISVDTIICPDVVMELCESFFSLSPPTRIRLRNETLAGTLETLTSGQADLAIGVVKPDASSYPGISSKPLGNVRFVYAVAPHHPLAQAPEPLSNATLKMHRSVAVADSAQSGPSMTIGLQEGQDVFTVSSMQAKLDGQLRGLGGGYLPYSLAGRLIEAGNLIAKKTQHPPRQSHVYYAWRSAESTRHGRALQWWLHQLEQPRTRAALLQKTTTNGDTPS